MLLLEQAGFATGGATLLAPLTVGFAPGRVTAVLGPNGAGKSTLLSLLSGQRQPSQGRVFLNGGPLAEQGAEMLARYRAVMPQDTTVSFDYTVREVVALGRYPHRRQPARDEDGLVDAAMATTDVAAFAERIYNTLSGGEKARCQLARALAQVWEAPPGLPTRWLLLDEPTAALDLSHQHQVLRCAQAWAHGQGVGVVAVLHDLNLALRYADDVLVLARGRCEGFGPAREVLTSVLVTRVWGVPCEPVAGAGGLVQYLFA